MLFDNRINGNPTDSTEQDCETSYYACQDANYDVQGVIDAQGVLKERYTYTPYGQRQVFFSPGSNDPKDYAGALMSRRVTLGGTPSVAAPYGLNPFGHQGLYHDEESGLVYNRARMYEPRLGRFMQRDPAGYSDSTNLYQYVRSEPNNWLDPSGNASIYWDKIFYLNVPVLIPRPHWVRLPFFKIYGYFVYSCVEGHESSKINGPYYAYLPNPNSHGIGLGVSATPIDNSRWEPCTTEGGCPGKKWVVDQIVQFYKVIGGRFPVGSTTNYHECPCRKK